MGSEMCIRDSLIDTPGHVDFSYEVSRSLSACEGALLVVDASQGVEAQSVANCYKAIDLNLKVIPVLNKIDLPSANAEYVLKQIEEIIGIDTSNSIKVSAKTGEGVEHLLNSIVEEIPPPNILKIDQTKALIIDETQKKLDEFKDNVYFQTFFFEVRKRLLAEKG